jgi:hypothetical protein
VVAVVVGGTISFLDIVEERYGGGRGGVPGS